MQTGKFDSYEHFNGVYGVDTDAIEVSSGRGDSIAGIATTVLKSFTWTQYKSVWILILYISDMRKTFVCIGTANT